MDAEIANHAFAKIDGGGLPRTAHFLQVVVVDAEDMGGLGLGVALVELEPMVLGEFYPVHLPFFPIHRSHPA